MEMMAEEIENLEKKNGGSMLLVSGGMADRAFVTDFMTNRRYDLILAVDGGLRLCHDAGILPTHLVGDFDTVEAPLLEQYASLPGICVIRHKQEKDATDTELAMELAIELHAAQIHILGGTGSRIDHSLANIYTLLHAHRKQIPCAMYDACNKLSLLEGERIISRDEQYGDYVSLLPVTETVKGITLEGFKYPLQEAVLSIGSSLGISNEIAAPRATIRCRQGILLVVESRD